MKNLDVETVSGFGEEWSKFDQSQLDREELNEIFNMYFKIFPWHILPADAVGFDLGCGSGRWSKCVAPKVGTLHCIDASQQALGVAQRNNVGNKNCTFHLASVDNMPLSDNSMDFGYSLGVLHHVPDTLNGIKSCVEKLKPGAPFLIYLYYRFDNRPKWFQLIWKISDIIRKIISKSPHSLRYFLSQLIAIFIYFPLSRLSKIVEKRGMNVSNLPLSSYRNNSFYTMRTDALDRFGTQLEQRFTKSEIQKMMEQSGLENITFSDSIPFWTAIGYKK